MSNGTLTGPDPALPSSSVGSYTAPAGALGPTDPSAQPSSTQAMTDALNQAGSGPSATYGSLVAPAGALGPMPTPGAQTPAQPQVPAQPPVQPPTQAPVQTQGPLPSQALPLQPTGDRRMAMARALGRYR